MNKSIKPRNNKGQHHGLWEHYYKGKLWYKCFFQNDKLVGYDESYYSNGKLSKKTYNI